MQVSCFLLDYDTSADDLNFYKMMYIRMSQKAFMTFQITSIFIFLNVI